MHAGGATALHVAAQKGRVKVAEAWWEGSRVFRACDIQGNRPKSDHHFPWTEALLKASCPIDITTLAPRGKPSACADVRYFGDTDISFSTASLGKKTKQGLEI